MGGGDLNLKKSWHPNTMKNMERVWKAEQKDNEEKKRIAELQREINAERDKEDMQKFAEDTGVVKKKDDVKLEWMYKGPSHSVNHEDYLLGKAIDKNFEKHQQEQQRGGPSTSQDEERVPDAIRQAKSSVFSEQVDVARKMNEDPLMAIRQRAVEKAKQLYDNPVRLKQLRKMIASKSVDQKKHKKDKKKKKKSKKSSEKDEELNALLTERLKSALKDRELLRKLKKKASKSSDSSSSDSSSNESDDTTDQRRKQPPVDIVRKRSHSPKHVEDHRRKDYSSSHNAPRDRRRQSQSPKPHKSRSLNENSGSSRKKSRSRSRDGDSHKHLGTSKKRVSRSRSRERHYQREYDRDSERKPGRNNRKSKSPATSNPRKHVPEKRKNKDRSPSSDNDSRRNNDRSQRSSTSSSDRDHLSDSDDDRSSKKKRSFGLIMADGSRPVPKPNLQSDVKPAAKPQKPNPPSWQRKERVKLSEEEKERRRQEMLQNASWRDKEREENVKRYRKEDDREKQQLHENFDEDFARKQFSKAASQASVEGRIKSKLNTIQRSRMSMDQNFARR